jgi:hypothetical protein
MLIDEIRRYILYARLLHPSRDRLNVTQHSVRFRFYLLLNYGFETDYYPVDFEPR